MSELLSTSLSVTVKVELQQKYSSQEELKKKKPTKENGPSVAQTFFLGEVKQKQSSLPCLSAMLSKKSHEWGSGPYLTKDTKWLV